MNWKVFLAVGALAGGVAVAATRRRPRHDFPPNTLWAEATDPVTRFGG